MLYYSTNARFKCLAMSKSQCPKQCW